MKKLILASLALASIQTTFGQNIILSEDFQARSFPYIQVSAVAPGILADSLWYDIDGDAISDASGSTRPGEWFLTVGFADVDTMTNTSDTNFVFASNSWCDCSDRNQNMLILPAIHVTDNTVKLNWKSAPFQTPRFMDGYSVVVSTGSNEHSDQFNDTIFKAAEFISQGDLIPDTGYAEFVFGEGYVHGEDGTFVEYKGDSLRFTGVLKPFELNLDQYIGQDIYIAFLHNSTDDNLISIDDIQVSGNGYLAAITGINDIDRNIGISLSPNPANDYMVVAFALRNSAETTYEIVDISGKVVASSKAGYRIKGEHKLTINTQELANGNYILNVFANGDSKLSERFTVAH